MAVEGTARSSDPAGRFGKYEIIAKIGQGAMGEVYKARDTVLDRFVAIKTMSAAVLGDPELGQRFLREAQSAARLNHPNVVTLHEFGEDAGRLFMAMELLEGEDLKGLLKRGGLTTLEDKLAVMEQILDGVAYAHGAGVIHRDLKPANIHVQPNGHVKVMDFGLARLGESEMTRAGTVMGTPNYMSPEQVRGERVGPPSDVFALGAVFYEVIGGRRAFEADSMHAVLYMVTNSDPIPLAERLPDCPRILETFVSKALAKDPELRYRDGNEMRGALELCRSVLDGGVEEEAAMAAFREATTVIQAPGDATLPQMKPTTGVAPTVALPQRGASGQSGSLPAVRGTSGSFPSVRRGTRSGSKPPVTPGTAPRAEAPASGPAGSATPSRAPLYIGAAAIAALILTGTALVLRRPQAPVAAPADRQQQPLVSVTTQATPPAFKAEAEPAKEASPAPVAAGRPDPSPVRVLKPSPPPALTTVPATPPTTTAVAAPAKPPTPLPTLAPAPALPTLAAAPLSPVVAAPPPATSAPLPTLGDEAAVRQLVASFERAIEDKDLALYKKVRPGLTPEDERRLRDAFNNVSSQQVDYSVDAISFDGDKATLHVTRTGRVSGQAVPPMRQVLRLARTASGWVIAEIGQ